MSTKYDRPVGVAGQDIAIGAGGVGFDSRAGQIGHSGAKVSPTWQYFFGAVLPSAEMDPATRYTISRNAESIGLVTRASQSRDWLA